MGLFDDGFLDGEMEGELEGFLSDLVALEPEPTDSLVYTNISKKYL